MTGAPKVFESSVGAWLGQPGRDVEAMLARGPAVPTTLVSDALPRASELVGRSVGPRTTAKNPALLARLLDRWRGETLGDLTVPGLDHWYRQLRDGTAGPRMSRGTMGQVNRIVWTALTLDALEHAAGETVTAAGFGLLPAWAATSGVKGTVDITGVGIALGNLIGRRTAQTGSSTSIAQSIPHVRTSAVWVTEGRLLLAPSDRPGRIVWTLDRSQVAGAHRYPHLQVMCRMKLVFVDGSSAAWFAGTKGPALEMERVLGRV